MKITRDKFSGRYTVKDDRGYEVVMSVGKYAAGVLHINGVPLGALNHFGGTVKRKQELASLFLSRLTEADVLERIRKQVNRANAQIEDARKNISHMQNRVKVLIAMDQAHR